MSATAFVAPDASEYAQALNEDHLEQLDKRTEQQPPETGL